MQNRVADLMVARIVQEEVNEAVALDRQDEQEDSEGESDGLHGGRDGDSGKSTGLGG